MLVAMLPAVLCSCCMFECDIVIDIGQCYYSASIIVTIELTTWLSGVCHNILISDKAKLLLSVSRNAEISTDNVLMGEHVVDSCQMFCLNEASTRYGAAHYRQVKCPLFKKPCFVMAPVCIRVSSYKIMSHNNYFFLGPFLVTLDTHLANDEPSSVSACQPT